MFGEQQKRHGETVWRRSEGRGQRGRGGGGGGGGGAGTWSSRWYIRARSSTSCGAMRKRKAAREERVGSVSRCQVGVG